MERHFGESMNDPVPELLGGNYPVFAKLDALREDGNGIQEVERLHRVANWLLNWHRLNSSDETGLAVFRDIERILDDK